MSKENYRYRRSKSELVVEGKTQRKRKLKFGVVIFAINEINQNVFTDCKI